MFGRESNILMIISVCKAWHYANWIGKPETLIIRIAVGRNNGHQCEIYRTVMYQSDIGCTRNLNNVIKNIIL